LNRIFPGLLFFLIMLISVSNGEETAIIKGNENEPTKADDAFINEGLHEVITFKFLFPMQCTLQTYYLSSDTTKTMTWSYIPFTVTLGVDIAAVNGYFHAVPKFCCELNMVKGDYPFWGVGGAIAFEVHPFPTTERNPYMFVSSGVIDMTQMDYEGMGYYIDTGFGIFLPLGKSFKVSPFLAYPFVSHWEQIRETEVCTGSGYPLYNGRKCDHVGIRIGFSVHYKSVWEKRWK
jgi:hypothetical protein